MVASRRREAASIQSQSAGAASAGRYRPRAIRSKRPAVAARYRPLRDRPASAACPGVKVSTVTSSERYRMQIILSAYVLFRKPWTRRRAGRRGPPGPLRCDGMRIPTDDEILGLHEKLAPAAGAFDLVYTHCVIVCGIAEQLHSRLRTGQHIDIDLARAGALLHDVGVYRLYDKAGKLDGVNYIRHGILGYELLVQEGLPEAICRFASHHTGVGLTRDDVIAQRLPLPAADYPAETDGE